MSFYVFLTAEYLIRFLSYKNGLYEKCSIAGIFTAIFIAMSK